MTIRCAGSCGRTPGQILAYRMFASEESVTPDVWVSYNEGTYNVDTGAFLCDTCYIEAGMPVAEGGWKA